MKKASFSKKKRVVSIVLAFCVILALFILIIQLNTNSLMKRIENAFLSSDYYVAEDTYSEYPESYSNPNINYVVYKVDEQRYDINRWFNRSRYWQGDEPDNVRIDLRLNRLFTIHNFLEGYIWLYYRVEYFDKNGNSLSGGATSDLYPVKMKIHKENGEWQVVQIWERP